MKPEQVSCRFHAGVMGIKPRWFYGMKPRRLVWCLVAWFHAGFMSRFMLGFMSGFMLGFMLDCMALFK